VAPRTQERAAAEREHLFRSAWAVLKRSGYANASITEILAEAGISTRAFYRHFASKDDLLVAMFVENADVAAERVAARVATADTALARVEAWVDAILDLGYEARTRTSARLFASPAVRGVFEDAGQAAIAHLYAPLREALADGLAAGELPTADPANDAETIYSITWRLVLDQAQGRSGLSREQAGVHVRRFVLAALGASPG